MDRPTLLRRIDAILAERKARGIEPHSDSGVSIKAGLGRDFIRNLRRHSDISVKVDKLFAIAGVLDVPARHFIEAEDSGSVATLIGDPGHRARIHLAFRAADKALRGMKLNDEDPLRADVATAIYEVLTERAAAGETVDEKMALGLIDELVRRILLIRLDRR